MGSQIKMLTLSPRPLAILLPASAVISAHTAKVKKPYVESYWESWDAWEHYPGDFGAFLKDIPASPPGSCKGVNLINISYTIPATVSAVEPWMSTIRQTVE